MFLSFVLSFVGVGCAGWGCWLLLRGYRARSWPVTEGEVVIATIEEQFVPRQGLHYLPYVRYRYDVAGVTYAGSEIQIGGRWGETFRREDAVRLADQHGLTRGRRIAVRYNPHDPAEAVLHAGTSPPAWGFFGLAVVAGFYALVFAFW